MVDTRFFVKNGGFTLAKIADVCGATLADANKGSTVVADIATMDSAGQGDICFFYDKKKKDNAGKIKATACITTEELAQFVPDGVIVLTVTNPKSVFLTLNEAMYSVVKPEVKIAATAKIHPTAKLGKNCSVADYVVIDADVEIGDDVIIEPSVVIAKGCKIGNNCRLGASCSISYTIMGDNCYIFAGARLGQDGFGFQTINGVHKRIPQLGRVIIGNDVEIGACSCVDRGALDDTIIGDGCRIDNLVQVAHNDTMGRGCVLVSMTGIAGSCNFGDYVVCGGQAGIADHINIGSGAQIGAQSGVLRDVEPGALLMGTPAVPLRDFMRQVSFVQKSTKK